jgi:hypothetical protein
MGISTILLFTLKMVYIIYEQKYFCFDVNNKVKEKTVKTKIKDYDYLF